MDLRDTEEDAAYWMGALCVDGDRACAGGALDVLGLIAERLAAAVPMALRGDLIELAERCRRDDLRAVAEWMRLKHHVHGQLPRSGERTRGPR